MINCIFPIIQYTSSSPPPPPKPHHRPISTLTSHNLQFEIANLWLSYGPNPHFETCPTWDPIRFGTRNSNLIKFKIEPDTRIKSPFRSCPLTHDPSWLETWLTHPNQIWIWDPILTLNLQNLETNCDHNTKLNTELGLDRG